MHGETTDAAILDGLPAERPVIVGDGGSAAAFREALPHARVFSRRGDWPPEASDADLVVHATSERDEVLVELERGQTLVELPYPDSATAARRARRPARPSSAASRCSSRRGPRRSSSGRACPRRST